MPDRGQDGARETARYVRDNQDRNPGRQVASPPANGRTDLGRPEDDLAVPGSGGRGAAPEGGTANSASAKVPPGHLAPRHPRTPARGIQRRGACTEF
jgi:hypothetical protein